MHSDAVFEGSKKTTISQDAFTCNKIAVRVKSVFRSRKVGDVHRGQYPVLNSILCSCKSEIFGPYKYGVGLLPMVSFNFYLWHTLYAF